MEIYFTYMQGGKKSQSHDDFLKLKRKYDMAKNILCTLMFLFLFSLVYFSKMILIRKKFITPSSMYFS